MAHDWCIASIDVPEESEIRATAERVVRDLTIAYRVKHHWERIKFEPVSRDGLTGAPAKLEAIRRIQDGPETPGRRFLRDRKQIFKDVPKTPKAKTTASRAMLGRLSTPIPFKPGENDIADD